MREVTVPPFVSQNAIVEEAHLRRIDFFYSALVCSLSSDRHSYIGLVCNSHFIDSKPIPVPPVWTPGSKSISSTTTPTQLPGQVIGHEFLERTYHYPFRHGIQDPRYGGISPTPSMIGMSNTTECGVTYTVAPLHQQDRSQSQGPQSTQVFSRDNSNPNSDSPRFNPNLTKDIGSIKDISD
jgi:hypothetical protein